MHDKFCLNLGDLVADTAENTESPCVGVFFRYTENNYVGGRGTKFVIQKQISLLKKMSCPGCSECGWVVDDAREGMNEFGDAHFEFDDSLRHGDVVTLDFVVDGRDWEMGHVDAYHLKVVKVQPSTTPTQSSSS